MSLLTLPHPAVGLGGFCPPLVARPQPMLACPRCSLARSYNPWPTIHGQPVESWVTPHPSSRALSLRPCRGVRWEPSPQPCRAAGLSPLVSGSGGSIGAPAVRGERNGLPDLSSPLV